MKKLLIIPLLAIMVSCGGGVENQKTAKKITHKGFIQGTTYAISYIDTEESVTKKELEDILHDLDKSCSIYEPTSLISRINRGECDTLDKAIKYCIKVSGDLWRKSDGLYDITIKPLTEAYGFAAKDKSSNVNVDSLLQFIGFDKIKIDGNRIVKSNPHIEIDLNSIAQGYSSDVIAEYFDFLGIKNYLVEIGGEIYAKGCNLQGEEWRVGIDKPIDGNYDSSVGFQSIVSMSNLGLATSGNYRKFYTDDKGNRVHHTINPKTGHSTTNSMLSATILAENATIADGYATVCMVSGIEKSREILSADTTLYALLVYSEGDSLKTYITPNLESKLSE